MKLEWLDKNREQFQRLSEKLPQALLIHGEPGVGKSVLAIDIVSSLLCDAPVVSDGIRRACGHCHNCTLFLAGSHPDFHYISSEAFVGESSNSHLVYAERYLEDATKRSKRKPRRVISVEQIRRLIEDFSLSHHSSDYKLALLQPAEAMNVNAANALLKLLEEPNSQSVLILVCHQIAQLPMTIRSRCVTIKVDAPQNAQAVVWLRQQGFDEIRVRKALAISNGAPLVALSYCQSEETVQFEALLLALSTLVDGSANAIGARSEIVKLQSTSLILGWLQLIMKWLILASQPGTQETSDPAWRAYESDILQIFNHIQRAGPSQIFRLYDDLLKLKQQDVNIINANLMLDKWLIAFAQRCARK